MNWRRVVICLGVCALLATALSASPVEPRPGLRLPHEAWSSLAWSPDGKTIAFIVTTRSLSPTESDGRLKGARIYLLSVDSGRKRLLGRIHGGYYDSHVPFGLFWLSNNRIGWSASGDDGDVRFLCSSTRAFKAEQLADIRMGLSRWNTNGMDDVYYDAGLHRLVFTGSVPCSVLESVSKYVVCSYDLRTKELRALPCPADAADAVTACVRRTGTGRMVYDIAYHADQSVLWETLADGSGRAIRARMRSQHFPRPSPNGRLLAFVQGRVRIDNGVGDDLHDDLVLYDTVSKSERVVATMLTPCGMGLQPTLGATFCWSPKGDRIAYADGESIKFVKVPRSLGSAKRARR